MSNNFQQRLQQQGRALAGARALQRAESVPSGQRSSLETALNLEVVAGQEQGRVINVPNSGLTLGRATDGSGDLGDDAILSRHHARLGFDNGAMLWIEDAASRNGTFVNGRRVLGRVYLESGDTVRLGATQLRVGAADAGHATVPMPAPGQATYRAAVRTDERPQRGRRTAILFFAVVLVAVLTVAGIAVVLRRGEGNARLSKAEFVQRGNALCENQRARAQELGLSPDASVQEVASFVEQMQPSNDAFISAVTQLKPPVADDPTFGDLLAKLNAINGNRRDLVAQVQQQQIATASETLRQGTELGNRAVADELALGWASCR
jgi:hypothetical protein